eukprot:TRINITY_DN18441_c0_g1_i1.p1 TRINITY_DN18441_c0_g1~~TRINITY_DN18441_c0_g1_i1.p1  ORF type:complete len:526 (+),score=32.33 TRINITY_DN18441_c0_g1_i1:214-1578(+)
MMCKNFRPVSTCAVLTERVDPGDNLSGAKNLCEMSCVLGTKHPCVYSDGLCTPRLDVTCHSCSSPSDASLWPNFIDSVAEHLFTLHDGFCHGDSLPELPLYSLWLESQTNETSSVCDGDAQENARHLRQFYEQLSREELTGSTTHAQLKNFRARYTLTAHIWPAGQSANPKMLTSKAPKAIFVLGPSGAGKTYSTKLRLKDILQSNGWDATLNFMTIDGGEMREQGVVWKEVKELVKVISKLTPIVGFKDAYKTIGRAGSSPAKKMLQDSFISNRLNVIIPDTLSDSRCILFSTLHSSLMCPAWKLYKRLRKANYDIVLVGINTDKNNCMAQGAERALSENKQYTKNGWEVQITGLVNFFNQARAAGNKNVFMIADNNNHPKISMLQFCKPGSGAVCRKGSIRWYDGAGSVAKFHRKGLAVMLAYGRIDYPCVGNCLEVSDHHQCPTEEAVTCD